MLTHMQLPGDTQNHPELEDMLDCRRPNLSELIRDMNVASRRGFSNPKGQPSQPVSNQLEEAGAASRNMHPTPVLLRRAQEGLQIGHTDNQLRVEVGRDRIPPRMGPLSMAWSL